MTPPRPSALRLVTCAQGAKAPKPPLGLQGWSTSADALALLLDPEASDLETSAGAAVQIPLASTLPPGTAVIVLGAAAIRPSLWALVARPFATPRAVRCGALLVRGYVDIGAGTDEVSGADLAWGSAPPAD